MGYQMGDSLGTEWETDGVEWETDGVQNGRQMGYRMGAR
jgi:hypothetical protein